MNLINLAEMDDTFEILPDYECQSRNGMFEDEDRYYVLSKQDLRHLIDRLTRTYEQMPDEELVSRETGGE